MFSDGVTRPLDSLGCAVDTAAVATVAAKGFYCKLTGVAAGTATLTLSFEGLQATVPVEVLPARRLAAGGTNVWPVAAAANDDGTVTLAWTGWDLGAVVIRRYSSDLSTFTPLDFELGQNQRVHSLILRRDQRALLIWSDLLNIYGSFYTPTDGWQTANVIAPIPTLPTYNTSLKIRGALADSGTAVVVWQFTDDALADNASLYASRYAPGIGWSAAAQLGSASSFVFGASAAGHAIAAWGTITGRVTGPGFDSYTNSASVATMNAAGDWSDAALLDDSNYSAPDAVAVNDTGTAIVAWAKGTSSGGTPLGAVKSEGSSWSAPAALAFGPSAVGIDSAGNVASIGYAPGISAQLFTPLDGWGAKESLGGGNLAQSPLIVAPDGTAQVGWAVLQFGANTIELRHFDAVLGWQAVPTIRTPSFTGPNFVFDRNPSGAGVVFWSASCNYCSDATNADGLNLSNAEIYIEPLAVP